MLPCAKKCSVSITVVVEVEVVLVVVLLVVLSVVLLEVVELPVVHVESSLGLAGDAVVGNQSSGIVNGGKVGQFGSKCKCKCINIFQFPSL